MYEEPSDSDSEDGLTAITWQGIQEYLNLGHVSTTHFLDKKTLMDPNAWEKIEAMKKAMKAKSYEFIYQCAQTVASTILPNCDTRPLLFSKDHQPEEQISRDDKLEETCWYRSHQICFHS